MNALKQILHHIQDMLTKSPISYILAPLIVLVCVILLKWRLSPPIDVIWLSLGGVVGIFFFDAAERFFGLSPSPFRSVLFVIGFMVVSLYVVTSSGSLLANGLVLSLYTSIIMRLFHEWQKSHNIDSWMHLLAVNLNIRAQQIFIAIVSLGFLLELIIFVR